MLIKGFRKLLRKKKTQTNFCYINYVDEMYATQEFYGQETSDSGMLEIVDEFKDVFRSNLSKSLSPYRSVDHEINTNETVKSQIVSYSNCHRVSFKILVSKSKKSRKRKD